MQIRGLSALLAGVALLTGSIASAQAPSLAELAKREEERRKALKAPVKVLTAPEAPKAPTAVPPAAADKVAAADKADKEKKEAAQPGEPVKDEAWWKARVSQVREDMRRNEMFAEALQTRINSLTNDFAARDDPYQRARIGEDKVKALTELERVKADIELQKKKLADIEEEARRAGVPPGWLR